MKALKIRKPDDMHLHLRQGEMLKNVLVHTVKQCGRAIVMPNTLPPILTPDDLTKYRQEIMAALPKGSNFTPLMTFKVVPTTTPELVKQLKQAGATAGKLYPEGVTTNSEDGVSDFRALYPVFEAMEKIGLALCLHGEVPGIFCLDREAAFLDTLRQLAKDFPKLRIVLEHVTTAAAVEAVESLPANVAATITVHHLQITLDDVVGDKINPHHFCKPIAKRPEDREALRRAAISNSGKFFLGTDSAPHSIESKECACGAAGVYSAPVMLPVLAEIFEELGVLERLAAFTSEFGAKFYDLPLNKDSITLQPESWTVPSDYDNVVSFMAGKTLSWKLA